ncbi:MAG: DHH family phosphoesterase [archaeon]|jgi:nanoRNase/pAp phosphatase (c-di-AMP/oligoRNAs hydrolase)
MSKLTPQKLIKLCKKKSVLLLCHDNADLDSFCSAAIIQRFLKKKGISSSIGVPSHINDQAQNFAFGERVSFTINPNLKEFELVLLFDLNDFNQLGKLKKEFETLLNCKCIKVIVFDHHVPHEKSIVNKSNSVIDSTCVSTTQVTYNFLVGQNKVLQPPKKKRFFLDTLDNKMNFWNCIGILEDTGHFTVGNTNAFTSFSNSLKNSKKSYSDVLNYSRHVIPDGERIAFLKAAKRAQIIKIGEAIVVTSELSFYQSAAATKLLSFGADIALVCGKEKTGLTTLSVRAESGFCNKHKFNLVKDLLTSLQKQFSGEMGGHSGAAQWKGKVLPTQILSECISILRKKLI